MLDLAHDLARYSQPGSGVFRAVGAVLARAIALAGLLAIVTPAPVQASGPGDPEPGSINFPQVTSQERYPPGIYPQVIYPQVIYPHGSYPQPLPGIAPQVGDPCPLASSTTIGSTTITVPLGIQYRRQGLQPTGLLYPIAPGQPVYIVPVPTTTITTVGVQKRAEPRIVIDPQYGVRWQDP